MTHGTEGIGTIAQGPSGAAAHVDAPTPSPNRSTA